MNKEPDEDLATSFLARIIELVRESDSVPLILKSTEEDRSCAVLTAETGAKACELDTLVTGPDDPPPDYYESVMLQNLHALIDAMRE